MKKHILFLTMFLAVSCAEKESPDKNTAHFDYFLSKGMDACYDNAPLLSTANTGGFTGTTIGLYAVEAEY